MKHISQVQSKFTASRGGGRISSDQFRQSQNLSSSFLGLEQDTSRYDLLLLVKRVGKHAGFSPRMIQLLDYYMAYTIALDWEEGSRPIVFQSLARTALDLGVTERQIQKLEKQLFEAGAITWNDSGNHKRYGKRDPKTARLSYAYGVELTPLAFLKSELEAKLQEKMLYAKAWQTTKREISSIRRELRALLSEWQARGARLQLTERYLTEYQEIAIQLRSHLKLHDLRELLRRHSSLKAKLQEVMGVGTSNQNGRFPQSTHASALAKKRSASSEPKYAHSQYSNPKEKKKGGLREKPPSYEAPKTDDPSIKAIGEVSLQQLVDTSSHHFRAHLADGVRQTTWSSFVEAAHRRRAELDISQEAWATACGRIGRIVAAICLSVADKAASRPGGVAHPNRYFLTLVQHAQNGSLQMPKRADYVIPLVGEVG